MADVSNKTIVALLAIALVITVVGTVVSVGKLNSLGGHYAVLSGAATEGTGTTSITVSGTTAIVVNTSAITLYSGYYNQTCSSHFSAINTSESDGNDRDVTCWVNLSGIDNATNNRAWHEFANNGTTVINVTAYVTASSTTGASAPFNATEILCGAGNCPAQNANALVMIKSAANESNSCTEGTQTAFSNLLTSTSQSNVTLCNRFEYADANDEMNAYFYLQIPDDADQGARGFTVTYYATAK